MRVRLNFIKDVLHLSTYLIFFCQSVACLFKENIVFRAIILKKWNLSKKKNKKNERKAELLKGVLHLSTQSSFLARILLLIQGSILSSRQIVTCKQH